MQSTEYTTVRKTTVSAKTMPDPKRSLPNKQKARAEIVDPLDSETFVIFDALLPRSLANQFLALVEHYNT